MTPTGFWDWFGANEPRLWAIDDRHDDLLDEIQKALSSYRQALCFEVSDVDDGQRELIISAAGDPELFDAVEALVAHAPRRSRWKMTALRPPRGFNFVLETSTARLDPKAMVFEPLSSDANPKALGIRVYLRGGSMSADRSEGVARVLETGLGERARSYIQHLEVAPLSASPSEHIPLGDLPAYIEWFKSRTSSA